ncbi:GumC family protein [Terrihabitans sp. B22-R8]|uniref:GumC family protein n=1 Tax=Terrihabitans sp. B22-R8 TaxID=3425128 RepID=UPI00403C467F
MPAAPTIGQTQSRAASDGEIDLGRVGRALWRRKGWVVVPTLLAAVAAAFVSGQIVPKFKSQALILVEAGETPYTRPADGGQSGGAAADELAVQSQVQLLLSRDLAVSVVRDLGLADKPEFVEEEGPSGIAGLLTLLGIGSRDDLASREEKALQSYIRNLTVSAVPVSRVISVEFASEDPNLAAEATNAIAERYLQMQQSAKQAATQRASTWLNDQIGDMSRRVAEAEARVEKYRADNNLFTGANNSTLPAQQLNDLNSALTQALGQQSEAEAKAAAVRRAITSGRPAESLDLVNSEQIRRLADQRGSLAAAMAREARTFLPGHPRMQQLNAQLASIDAQIRDEGGKLARAFENEAKLAEGRVANIRATLDTQKTAAGAASEQEVQLRALEREARAQRDLLEQFLTRYRDATARQQLESTPADARIISRAAPAVTPYTPQPLAIIAFSSIAMLLLAVIVVALIEFLSQSMSTSPMHPEPAGRSRKRLNADSAGAAPVDPQNTGNAGQPRVSALTGSPDMEIEAADMRMLSELAAHLAATPKGEGALNILAIAASSKLDVGGIALSLARSLANGGRKPIVVDAGGESERFGEALGMAAVSGLGELAAGDASFSQAIQRDKASSVHLIARGKADPLDSANISRIGLIFDALGLTYDFVIVVGPSAERNDRMKALAKHTGAAILVARDAGDTATTAIHNELLAAGLSDIIVLVAENHPVMRPGNTTGA